MRPVARAVAVALVLVVVAGTAGVALLPDVRAGLSHVVDLLAVGDLAGVRDYLRSFGVWAPLVSAALVQVQAIVAPLPSFPIMYANGLLFGTWWGGLLSWASILLSALLCFGLGRLLPGRSSSAWRARGPWPGPTGTSRATARSRSSSPGSFRSPRSTCSAMRQA